jgi:hypothetical protein
MSIIRCLFDRKVEAEGHRSIWHVLLFGTPAIRDRIPLEVYEGYHCMYALVALEHEL